ncbi:MAG: FG-GAP repeat protein, partial [Myxococcales bacterium]|nr:FG-GAP repeat protein [Myxococcales bacterium]
TGVDCGGPRCAACAAGAACLADRDCLDGACRGALCQAPACDDGVQNGREAGVDCGGPLCAGCPLGGPCRADADCALGLCLSGTCQGHPCRNGVQDGLETAVDCGGACAGCLGGQACQFNADCRAGDCRANVCFVDPPVIEAVDPPQVAHVGGARVTLTGLNFQIGVALRVNGVPTAVTRVSDRTLTFTAPASPAGPGPLALELFNPDGGQGTAAPGALQYSVEGLRVSLDGGQGAFCDTWTCTASGQDAFNPPIPVQYQWTLNGQPAAGGATLADAVQVGDEVACAAVFGEAPATWTLAAPPQTVQDGVGLVADVRVSPQRPSLGEAIRCEGAAQPTHCGQPSALQYTWWVDDAVDAAQVDAVFPTAGLPAGTRVRCELVAVSPVGRNGPPSAAPTVTVTKGRVDVVSEHGGDRFGYAVSVPGDLDGDGFADLVVGAPEERSVPGRAEAGRIYVFSGGAAMADQVAQVDARFWIDGEQGGVPQPGGLHNPPTALTIDRGGAWRPYGSALGFALAVGQRSFIDGDAVPDLVVGAPYADLVRRPFAGKVYALSGAAAPGIVDLQTAAAEGDPAASTVLGAAAAGGYLPEFQATLNEGPLSGGMLGRRVAAIGDFNGDG